MADQYVYAIDVSNYDGAWRNVRLAQLRQTLERRSPSDVARAILQNWIVDHPNHLAGGERMMVFEDDQLDYPPDEHSHVRVWIFRGSMGTREPEPAAAAYLVDLPDE